MQSKKATKKSSVIFLVIDLLLVIFIAAAGLFCYKTRMDRLAIPDCRYEEVMAEYDSEETRIEVEKTELLENAARAESEAKNEIIRCEELVSRSRDEYDAALAAKAEAEAALTTLSADIDFVKDIEANIVQLRIDYGKAVRQLEDMILAGESEYRICYLTFDDGPSYLTNQFLDKLDELDVYVTFFTIGCEMSEKNYDLRDQYLRREALSGHTIANHTYTHAYYGPLYVSVDSFMDAVHQQDETVYNATGLHTDIVRFPAGSYYCNYRSDTIDALHEDGYVWIDWSANALDAGGLGHSASSTASTVIFEVRQEKISVVLMHDWVSNTLGSLDRIVTTLKEENYLFLPLFKESSAVETVRPKWDF